MISVNSIVSKVQGNTTQIQKAGTREEIKAPTYIGNSSLISKTLGGLVVSLAALITANAEGANNPKREKAIANFAQESWKPLSETLGDEKKYKELNNSTILWNNLQAAFHISDDTMIEAVEPIRAEVLEKGKSNSSIPARLVHGALYTTGVTANKLNLEVINNQKKINTLSTELKTLQKQTEGLNQIKATLPKELTSRMQELEGQINQLKKDNSSYIVRRDKMVSTVIPYLGKMIVDTKDKDGVAERHLLPPSRIDTLKKYYPVVEIYNSKDFHLTAADALGKIAETTSLEKSLAELFGSGGDNERRSTFFEIYLSTPQNKLPKGLVEKSS